MKLIAIIQARVSSLRLPTKVMTKVKHKPILEYVYERVNLIKKINKIVVATSHHREDNLINEYCNLKKICCYRGPLNNVAKRILNAAKKYQADGFIRISADSPLLDFNNIERGIYFFNIKKHDILTNIFPRTFPHGQSFEIINTKSYEKIYKKIKTKFDQEHVTSYIYNNYKSFKIFSYRNDVDLHNYNFSIDTKYDLLKFSAIVKAMNKNHTEYNLIDIIKIFNKIKKNIL